MDQQQAWAEALRKAKNQSKQLRSAFNTQKQDLLETQLLEQIAYSKKKFLQAVEQKNAFESELHAKKMVDLHARLTALKIKQLKEQGMSEDSPEIQNHLQAYFQNCQNLLPFLPENE